MMTSTNAGSETTKVLYTRDEWGHIERLGAYFSFAAAAFMALGGIIKRVVDVDLDAALSNGEIAGYLSVAADNQLLLSVNLSAWIIGVLFFGAAGTTIAYRCDQRRLLSRVAVVPYWTGVPLATASFVGWLAIIVQINPEPSSTELIVAEVLAWWVS